MWELVRSFIKLIIIMWQTFPEEMKHTCLVTSDKEPMKDQSMDATNVQLNGPMSFIGATYRNMGEELVTKAEMSQRQLFHQSLSQHR